MTCGIYKITNDVNGTVYVGKSKNIEARFSAHRCAAKSGENALYRAIRKYGVESFSFEILEKTKEEELNEKEIYWIEFFQSYKTGYNCTLGGDGGAGVTPSSETRKLLSEKSKQMWSDEGFREAMSEKHSGKNNGMYGKTHSPSTMKKIKAKAKRWSSENREYLSFKTKEYFENEENRKKTSEAAKKRFEDPKERKRISQARLDYFSDGDPVKRKRGIHSPYARPVICLDNGMTFGCAKDASRAGFGNVSQSARTGCKALGLRWVYLDEYEQAIKKSA